jgi:hypothetical protein
MLAWRSLFDLADTPGVRSFYNKVSPTLRHPTTEFIHRGKQPQWAAGVDHAKCNHRQGDSSSSSLVFVVLVVVVVVLVELGSKRRRRRAPSWPLVATGAAAAQQWPPITPRQNATRVRWLTQTKSKSKARRRRLIEKWIHSDGCCSPPPRARPSSADIGVSGVGAAFGLV